MGKSADAIAIREHVYQQMLAKFPASAIEWVRSVRWTGPSEVPLSEIDDAGRATWGASHDPHKVERDRQKELDSRAKPIILVRLPDGKKVIVDGHHRFLAAEQNDRDTVLAWTAAVPRNTGPWLETHSSQYGGPSV